MYRLLIVEDEEIIRQGLTEHIPWNKIGFNVVGEADNGKSAVDLIPVIQPDVILTDIKMPEMNGVEMMSFIKQEYPHIKVIVISGYNDFEYARKSVEYGAYSYLLKPVRETEIKEVFELLKDDLNKIENEKTKMVVHFDKLLEYQNLPFLKNLKSSAQIEQLLSTSISNSVIAKNYSEFMKLLDDFYDNYSSGNRFEFEEIYVKTIELIVILSARLYENGIIFQDICPEDFRKDIKMIIKTQSMLDLKNYLSKLFSRVIDYLNILDTKHSQYDDSSIIKVKQFIEENYNRKISLDEAAGIAYMSPAYFSTYFKKATGITYTDYLINVRVQKAKDLLRNHNLKVYEVALMVGYDDFRHFSKVFKKLNGIGPTQYKKMYLKEKIRL